MIFGRILADSIRVLNKKVEDMIEMAKFDYEEGQMEKIYDGELAPKCAATTKAVQEVIVLHLSIVHFSDTLNSIFGGLFCAGYCLDVLTLLSFVVALLAYTVQADSAIVVAVDLLGVGVFAVYCVAFYTPLIDSHEQASLRKNPKLYGWKP